MRPAFARAAALTMALSIGHPGIGRPQARISSWLDDLTPASWNRPGLPIPAAPRVEDSGDSRCHDQARPPQLEEDRRLRAQGWDLIGAYYGGWQILVIRGTAGYDGMCRPRRFQDFVFVRAVFAGTLSPQPMESRADGALARVFLQSDSRLTAEYDRYAPADPLCCSSGATRVVFEIAGDSPVVRPLSASAFNR